MLKIYLIKSDKQISSHFCVIFFFFIAEKKPISFLIRQGGTFCEFVERLKED